MRAFIGATLALLILAAPAHAQTDPRPPVSFTVNLNGVPTTVTVSPQDAANTAWNVGQYWRGAESRQNISQDAGATCLADASQATPANVVWDGATPPIPNFTVDWATARLIDPRDHAVLSVVPVTGAVYRNAMRLGNATVSKLCLYGEIFGKSKSTGVWFRWVGVSTALPSGWQQVPTDTDATVLN